MHLLARKHFLKAESVNAEQGCANRYMLDEFRKKYIGTPEFYRYALRLAVPMIVQNLITNFVSMLDNIMVGQIGTVQMSGVSIVNQFVFVFNITLFGGMSGAGIFGAQFIGRKDHEGHRYTFRFRMGLALLVSAIGIAILSIFGDGLISLFLSADDDAAMVKATLGYGRTYLNYMLLGFLPFAVGQAYSSIIRECGETRIPMYGALSAIGLNVFLDYALIFGHFGFPCMGVAGAAIATVAAKFVEAGIIIIWAHTHLERNIYLQSAYRSLYIPLHLAKDITLRGCPLLINEFLWSMGMSVIAQCYSVRGLEVVAARNIASTLVNLFMVVYIQLAAALGIMVGMKLGANDMDGARDTNNKMTFFAVAVTVLLGIVLIPAAYAFPGLYNTEPSVRSLASWIILMQALSFPIYSYSNACYFTLRSGGKTGITFLYDFIFTWFIMIPLAFVLSRSSMEVHLLFAVVTFSEIIKIIVGYFMVRSEIWMQNIIDRR